MMGAPLLEILKQDDELAHALSVAFDFFLCSPDPPNWFSVRATESFFPVAKDGAGGVFLVGQTSGRLLMVTSEGRAGTVACSLSEFFALVLTCPSWTDLLKFSGGGQLVEMHRVAPFLDDEFDDEASLTACRSLAVARLGMVPNEAAIDLLHRAVRSGQADVTVTAPDGTLFEGLFNHFTVDSHPFWRRA